MEDAADDQMDAGRSLPCRLGHGSNRHRRHTLEGSHRWMGPCQEQGDMGLPGRSWSQHQGQHQAGASSHQWPCGDWADHYWSIYFVGKSYGDNDIFRIENLEPEGASTPMADRIPAPV
jgi:hypothetical protein